MYLSNSLCFTFATLLAISAARVIEKRASEGLDLCSGPNLEGCVDPTNFTADMLGKCLPTGFSATSAVADFQLNTGYRPTCKLYTSENVQCDDGINHVTLDEIIVFDVGPEFNGKIGFYKCD